MASPYKTVTSAIVSQQFFPARKAGRPPGSGMVHFMLACGHTEIRGKHRTNNLRRGKIKCAKCTLGKRPRLASTI